MPTNMVANPNSQERAAKIAAINDLARKQPWNVNCKTNLTPGVKTLERRDQMAIRKAVEDYDRFNAGNNGWNERDFGAFDHVCISGEVHQIFWKIDYFEAGTDYLSPDPTDITVTDRVLTLMLDEEY